MTNKVLILLIFSFLEVSANVSGQKIDLYNVLAKTYTKPPIERTANGKYIIYILPYNIQLIDTSQQLKKNYPFTISYEDRQGYEQLLKKQHEVITLDINYESVSDKEMIISLILCDTKEIPYMRYKAHELLGETQVSLIYNPLNNKWEFGSILRLAEDPVVGGK